MAPGALPLEGLRVLELGHIIAGPSRRHPAPVVGEHTREVLAEIGLAQDEIDALASRRLIG